MILKLYGGPAHDREVDVPASFASDRRPLDVSPPRQARYEPRRYVLLRAGEPHHYLMWVNGEPPEAPFQELAPYLVAVLPGKGTETIAP